MVIAALLSPPLGAVADYGRSRKLFLFLFSICCIICTGLMFYVQAGMVALGLLLFVVANVGFEGGLVFYDAFLPRLTSKQSYGRVSGYGYAMGYLGALAVLVIINFLLPEASSADYLFYVRLSFVIAAAFFFVFSVPLFLFVPEPEQERPRPPSYIRAGMKQAAKTFKTLFLTNEHPSIARFLVAFFIYNDGILTVIIFAGIFAEHMLHMTDKEIIIFFATVQSSAILGSIFFGVVTDKIGPKKTIFITLSIWVAISITAFFVTTVAMFYAVGFAAGVAIGSSQSASRSMMALLTPKAREAEFFGFYDGLCGKGSAVIGPLVYGVIADVTSERFAALMIGSFFFIGMWLLRSVVEPDRSVTRAVTA
jgi:UMF1 family MFS transporter